MCFWDSGIFENDDALDWIFDLRESGSIPRVEAALDVILKNKGNVLEVSDCQIALVAAEVIAAMKGNPNPDLPEELEEWIGDAILNDDDLRIKAVNVVENILNDSKLPKSTLTADFNKAKKQPLQDLLKRLEI